MPREHLLRRAGAAVATLGMAGYFARLAVDGPRPMPIAIAATLGLSSALFLQRGLLGQIAARASTWLVFAPSAMIVLGSLRHGSMQPGILGLAAAGGTALLLARPMLWTEEARRTFAPRLYRRLFLAGTTATASAAIGAAAFSLLGVAFESPLMAGFNLAVAIALFASVVGVLRMRTWGLLLGAVTSVLLLALIPFYRASALTLVLAAAPALMFWVGGVLLARARVQDTAAAEPARIRVAALTEGEVEAETARGLEAEAEEEPALVAERARHHA